MIDTVAYKFRAYPNKTQESKIIDILTTCRYLYNEALANRIDHYKETKKTLTFAEQCKWLTQNKNCHRHRVYTQTLQATLRRLDTAFQRFFDGLKAKRRVGFPRFKNEQRFRSFTYPQGKSFRLLDGDRIRLPKIGNMKFVKTRDIDGIIKNASVVRYVDQWHIVLTVERELLDPPLPKLSAIGIDVGIKSFVTLSNGESPVEV